ncbi:hypothetical protein AAHA92_26998 [Salvia divinorum]|uniref:Uncharacterized protein n=1 Tax=Salvia divinorum TaxID=28513 RepID=A0ABD1G5F9_SALDI
MATETTSRTSIQTLAHSVRLPNVVARPIASCPCPRWPSHRPYVAVVRLPHHLPTSAPFARHVLSPTGQLSREHSSPRHHLWTSSRPRTNRCKLCR